MSVETPESNSDTKSDSVSENDAGNSTEVNPVTDETPDSSESDLPVDESTDSGTDTESEGFKTAVNQEVERVIQGRIQRFSDKVKKLQEESDASASRIQELEDLLRAKDSESEALKQENSVLVQDSLVWSVANQEGLSYDVVSSLKGSTLEELTAAARLVKESGKSNSSSVDRLFNGKGFEEGSASLTDIILSKYKK